MAIENQGVSIDLDEVMIREWDRTRQSYLLHRPLWQCRTSSIVSGIVCWRCEGYGQTSAMKATKTTQWTGTELVPASKSSGTPKLQGYKF